MINRSAIEGLWDGCLVCMEAKHVHGVVTAVVPTCENRQEETMAEGDFDYCPICSRPLTPEAWEEMRERVEALENLTLLSYNDCITGIS